MKKSYLKRLIAITMVITFMLSSLTSFASTTVKYEEEGDVLYELGLMQGYSETEKELGLEDDLSREAAMKLIASILGWEVDATATTSFTDVSSWAVPYVATAVEKGITNGISESQFGGQQVASMRQLVTWFLRALGYDNAWDNAAALAMEHKLATASELVAFEEPVKRDELAGVAYKALLLKSVGSDDTLIQQLVDQGLVDESKAIEVGLLEEPEPLKLDVETVECVTLVETKVVFNQLVDEESALDEDNYDLSEDIVDLTLLDDEITVIITHKPVDNQEEGTLEIDGVQSKDKSSTLKDYEKTIDYLDFEMPKVISVDVIGTYLFEVQVTEPLKVAEESSVSIKSVDSGKKLHINEITTPKGEEVNEDAFADIIHVKVYSKLEPGDYEISISGDMKDYANYSVKPYKEVVEAEEDKEGPKLVGYEDITSTEVTLIFDEPLKAETISKEDMYHTNAKKTAKDDVIPDGNKLTITFPEDEPLNEGTSYITVASDKLMDNWDNLAGTIIATVEREIDKEPPVIEKASAPEEDQIKLTFSEAVEEESAEKESNYTVKDSDGEEVDIKTIIHDEKTVTLVFKDDLTGVYEVAVKGVEDLSENKCDDFIEVDVDDSTAPELIGATLYGDSARVKEFTLIIRFNEPMLTEGKYSVLDLDKYIFNDEQLDDVDDVEIDITDGGKVVEITIPKEAGIVEAINKLKIGKVADEAGNTTEGLLVKDKHGNTLISVADGETGTVSVDTVELVESDTVVFTLDDKLDSIKEEEFKVYYNGTELEYSTYDVNENSDSNTTLTVTFKEELKTTSSAALTYAVEPAGENGEVLSKNEYGEPVQAVDKDDLHPIADKAAPEIALDEDDDEIIEVHKDINGGTITIAIHFTEWLVNQPDLITSDFVVLANGSEIQYGDDEEYKLNVNKNILEFVIYDREDAEEIFDSPNRYNIKIELEDGAANYTKDISNNGNKIEECSIKIDLKDYN